MTRRCSQFLVALSVVLATSFARAEPPAPPAGTIAFSPGAGKPGTNSFKITDSVVVRATLSTSIEDAFKAKDVQCMNRFFMWTIAVDGARISRTANEDGFYWIKPKGAPFETWTAVGPDQLVAPASPDPDSMAARFHELVAPRLAAGEHEIRVAVRGQCEDHKQENKLAFTDDLASGTFKLTVPKGMAVEVMPKAGRKDPKLVKDATLLLAAKWKDDKILAMVIVSKDWNVEYVVDAGRRVPTRRTLETVVATKQGDACQLFPVRLEQPARSNTTFGATAIAGTGDAREVDCAGIKK